VSRRDEFRPPVFDTAVRTKLLQDQASRESVFLEFPTQRQAFAFADAHADLCTFAVEYDTSGKRKFIVASIDTFWRKYAAYRREAAGPPHCYEVIREGAACKLYFDLEFHRRSNPNRDGDVMVDFMLDQTNILLRELYPGMLANVNLRHDNVIELESSTEKKFSRHIIIPQVTFRSNEDAGRFVKRLCRDCRKLNDVIEVQSEDGTAKTTFIDVGVYTKNRCFRLLGSSKFGKSRALTFSERSLWDAATTLESFTSSLVTNVSPSGIHLLMEPGAGEVCGFSMTNRPHNDEGAVTGSSRAHSPHPDADNFVWSIIRANGCKGYIRSWMFFPATSTMLYSISGQYRFCGRIGRHHKSNGVYFVADLKAREMYQKCFDPDCRNFRSNAISMPNARVDDAK